MITAVAHALMMALTMAGEILWALILGFWISGIIQAVVSKEQMTRLLPEDSAKTFAVACGLGAASSSCSYAAVALARSIMANWPSSARDFTVSDWVFKRPSPRDRVQPSLVTMTGPQAKIR